MKWKIKVVLAAVIVVMVAGVAATWSFAALSKDTRAPDFTAQTVTGKKFALEDLRGRAVLLDFFATWCPPCRLEVPELQKLWQTYGDKGLVVIGVALDSGGSAEIRKFAADRGLTYWQVSDDAGRIANKYGIRPIPTTYIIDPSGVIRYSHVGFGPGMEKELAKQIQSVLPKPEQLSRLKPLK
jgi:cytochrome c biogenesis protein CcmG/thiol:disulfide interchange protein DsbE